MTTTLLISYLTHYGYFGLFMILGISILGIPIPDEFLMTFVGFLSFTGKVNPVLAILSAAMGSISGITISYFLGKYFKEKIASMLRRHAGNQRLERVFQWYNRHGGKLLTIGYFIPGVRHLSGYVAGLSGLKYRSFGFFAYLGALLWTSTFISLGRILGTRWDTILPVIHRYSVVLGITITLLLVAFYLLYRNHKRWGAWVMGKLSHLPARYQTLGNRRLPLVIMSTIFVLLFVFLMGLTQDLAANEVGEFDELVVSGIELITIPWATTLMQWINAFGSQGVILLIFGFFGFQFKKKTKNWIHLVPLSLAWAGGTLIDQLFRMFFRGEDVKVFENLIPFQPPSSGFLLAALSFYVVLDYLLVRESSHVKKMLMFFTGSLFLIYLGLSPVFLRIHVPSTMVASVTVSFLWALICVFIYEFQVYQEETGRHFFEI